MHRAFGLAVLLLAGCDPSQGTIIVQVRTDLAPGTDFDQIRTTLTPPTGSPSETLAGADSERDWGLGVRVAELSELDTGDYRLRVEATLGGAVVVGRPVRQTLEGGVSVITVLLTRDCVDVECPGGGSAIDVACLAGRCVPEGCTEETPELCDTECSTPDDCMLMGGPCAIPECTLSGSCFLSLEHSMCAADETCESSGACGPNGSTCDTFTGVNSRLVASVGTTCLVSDDQPLLCWGNNADGQLGSSAGGSILPGVVHAPTVFSQLALGADSLCGVRASDGLVVCAGSDRSGQLGDGSGDSSGTTLVETGQAARLISGTASSFCVIDPADDAFCWGANHTGQLDPFRSETILEAPTVIGVLGGYWHSLSIGAGHSCGIFNIGSLNCWGAASLGELGIPGQAPSSFEQVGFDMDWESTEVSNGTSCGIRSGGASGGNLWCWGGGSEGQLGTDGMPGDTEVLGQVAGEWKTVAGRHHHFCGIRGDDSLWCWGRNLEGQLGIGGATGRSFPEPVLEGMSISSVAVGWWHSCAISTTGEIYCWGSNDQGQIGRAPGGRFASPTRVCP